MILDLKKEFKKTALAVKSTLSTWIPSLSRHMDGIVLLAFKMKVDKLRERISTEYAESYITWGEDGSFHLTKSDITYNPEEFTWKLDDQIYFTYHGLPKKHTMEYIYLIYIIETIMRDLDIQYTSLPMYR